jgi:hypothetical protein
MELITSCYLLAQRQAERLPRLVPLLHAFFSFPLVSKTQAAGQQTTTAPKPTKQSQARHAILALALDPVLHSAFRGWGKFKSTYKHRPYRHQKQQQANLTLKPIKPNNGHSYHV